MCEKYYYQCQEKNCEISTNGPKPCMIAVPKDQDRGNSIFCIYAKACKRVEWKEITKEQYDNTNWKSMTKEECDKESSNPINTCLFEFKGEECDYQGIATSCDKTLEDCRIRNNSERFGGFPGLPKNKKMIPTMRVNYFDGSYYTVRKDKPGWMDIIDKINKKKGQKFLCDLTKEEQLSTIKNVDLVKITEVEMTEEDYMKIPASPEIAEIQIELHGVTSIKDADRHACHIMKQNLPKD